MTTRAQAHDGRLFEQRERSNGDVIEGARTESDDSNDRLHFDAVAVNLVTPSTFFVSRVAGGMTLIPVVLSVH